MHEIKARIDKSRKNRNAPEEEFASGCIETKSSVDAYVEYMEIYKTALNAFNRDFPDGK